MYPPDRIIGEYCGQELEAREATISLSSSDEKAEMHLHGLAMQVLSSYEERLIPMIRRSLRMVFSEQL